MDIIILCNPKANYVTIHLYTRTQTHRTCVVTHIIEGWLDYETAINLPLLRTSGWDLDSSSQPASHSSQPANQLARHTTTATQQWWCTRVMPIFNYSNYHTSPSAWKPSTATERAFHSSATHITLYTLSAATAFALFNRAQRQRHSRKTKRQSEILIGTYIPRTPRIR